MSASQCPIVFVNFGLSEHLLYALTQARRLNPDTPVLLFCDTALPAEFNFVQHIPIQSYESSAKEFAGIYRHFSVNSEMHELVCMQRWFVIRDYIRANPCERVLHLDSDVLLFCDIRHVLPVFQRYDFALSRVSAHTSFMTPAVVEELCGLMTGYYTGSNASIVERIDVEKRREAPNGPNSNYCISDMTFVMHFRELTGRTGIEISQIHREAGEPFIFDHNINSPEFGFEMEGGFKKLEWIEGAPYGSIAATGEKVRMCSLHYQGGAAKPVVPDHFQRTGSRCQSWGAVTPAKG